MDKLYAGSSPIGVLSELLLAGLNGNSHVYHVSPVFTMMEIHVTRALARLYGFNGERAGGLSCPGGSASNQLAMVTARNSLYPEIKKHGYFPRPSIQQQHDMEQRGYSFAAGVNMSTYGKLIAFTSSAGHYSLEKSAVMMGLGTENTVSVPCDSYGSMIPSELGKRSFGLENEQ
jgi:glutamate decarboxylase